MGNLTKKQHYVWRKYLIPWTNNSSLNTGKIFVYRKAPYGTQNEIEHRELTKIGFEKYYYDISGFTDEDISFYTQFLKHLQQNNRIKLDINFDTVNLANSQRDFIEKEVMCKFENIDNEYKFLEKLYNQDISFFKDSLIKETLDMLQSSMVNSILCQEEDLSDEDLFSLYNQAIQSIGDPDLKYQFILFFSMQYFRSPRIHTNLHACFDDYKIKSQVSFNLNPNFHVNLLTLYFAEQMALNLTQTQNTSIVLYDNKSKIPFITGDTPIVNISDDDTTAVFHYPISPTIAINIITARLPQQNSILQIDNTNIELIHTLNSKIHQNCSNEVYSNSRRTLEKYNSSK